MTQIERQLCDILGLTDETKLAAKVKSLHDRYGDDVWPGRGPIPCFCGEINLKVREALGARPDEPVFSAAARVVKERDLLSETVSALSEQVGNLVQDNRNAEQAKEDYKERMLSLLKIIRDTRVALGGPENAMPLVERAVLLKKRCAALAELSKLRIDLNNFSVNKNN